MTNAQIILNESLSLMEQGILKGSGQFAEIETETMVEEATESVEE